MKSPGVGWGICTLVALAGACQAETEPLGKEGAEPLRMRTEPFSFVRDGVTLKGQVDYPAGRRPVAGIVLVSGHGKTDVARQFLDLRRRFTEAGLACCAWDRPGCGRSGGNFDLTQTVKDSGEEAALAVDAFSKAAGLDLGRIGFWGISRGTGISQAALLLRPALGFWISVSPPGDHDNSPYLMETNLRLEGRTESEVQALMAERRAGHRILRTGGSFPEYLAATRRLREDPFSKLLDGLGFGISEEIFLREQARHRAGEYAVDEKTETNCWPFQEEMARIRCPVLLLFGEKDTVLDWRDSVRVHREAFAAGGNREVTIRTFPDGNHSLQHCETGSVREMTSGGRQKACPGYFRTQLDWLQEHGFAEAPAEPEKP